MQDRPEPEVTENSHHDIKRPWTHSIFFIVLTAFLLRLAVITIGHTYRITPRRDHFQFGWEMGRIARSIATGPRFQFADGFAHRAQRLAASGLSLHPGWVSLSCLGFTAIFPRG